MLYEDDRKVPAGRQLRDEAPARLEAARRCADCNDDWPDRRRAGRRRNSGFARGGNDGPFPGLPDPPGTASYTQRPTTAEDFRDPSWRGFGRPAGVAVRRVAIGIRRAARQTRKRRYLLQVETGRAVSRQMTVVLWQAIETAEGRSNGPDPREPRGRLGGPNPCVRPQSAWGAGVRFKQARACGRQGRKSPSQRGSAATATPKR